jgi:hypothetical protein
MFNKFTAWLVAVLLLLAIWTGVPEGKRGLLVGIMLAWFVAATAWQVIRARKYRSVVAGANSAPLPREEGNQFDPEFCGRMLRLAAVCLTAMAIFEFVFFLTVKSTKCPGWQTPTEREGGSVWVILLFAAIWSLHISYRAVTWRRFSQKILDHIDWGRRTYVPGTKPTLFAEPKQFKAMCATKNNLNTIIIFVLLGSGIFVALPVLTRLSCF